MYLEPCQVELARQRAHTELPLAENPAQADTCCLDLPLTLFKGSQKQQSGAIWLTHFLPTHRSPSAPAHYTFEPAIP